MKTTTKFLTAAEAAKNGNSSINQRIKGEFIAKHVYCNVNSMVEYILNKGFEDGDAPFSLDDVDNFYTYPEYTGTYANFEGGNEDAKQKEVDRLSNIQVDNGDDLIESEIQDLKDLESEPQEVFEWWMVSSFLAEKLQEMGHPIIDSENIWGRCTTGQAILLDYAMTQICADMEILEGQRNSWA